jgi:hypothetical protein
MASLYDIYRIVERINADMPLLIERSKVTPKQIVTVTGLADISERLGLVQAGEFRTGNGKEPGFGFSGVRIGYPSFVYNGELWNIAGISNDVLQVGIRAEDGKMIAGGGDVTIDEWGITFANQNGAVFWEDTNGDIDNLRMYSDADNWIVIGNSFGGRGLTLLLDNASHVVSQIDFDGDGNIDLRDGYMIQAEQAGNPTTPAGGDWGLYFKSGGLYYIDDAANVTGPLGTNKRLPFVNHNSFAAAITADLYVFNATVDQTYTLIRWRQGWYVAITNDGSNYWTVDLTDWGGNVIATFNTSAIAADTLSQTAVTSFSPSTVDTTDSIILVRVTKTGAPGPLYLGSPALHVSV